MQIAVVTVSSTESTFVRRVALVFVAGLAFALVLAFGNEIGSLTLLAFGAALLGLALGGCARQLSRIAPVPRVASVAIVLVLAVAALAVFGLVFGARAVRELSEVAEQLPRARARLDELFGRFPAHDLQSWLPDGRTAMRQAGQWLRASMSAVSTGIILLVAGVYLAFQPNAYRRPLLTLVPPARREEAADIADRLASVLRSWLLARLASMTAVGVLVGVGLWIVGVPMWFGLGVLAAMLAFVPFLGPLLSFLPAAGIGLVEGGTTMLLWVCLVFAIAQVLEGTLITPLIERWAVSLPPAFLLFVQVFAGLVAGLPGVLFATPLAVVVVFLVQVLYVERTLGEEVAGLDG